MQYRDLAPKVAGAPAAARLADHGRAAAHAQERPACSRSSPPGRRRCCATTSSSRRRRDVRARDDQRPRLPQGQGPDQVGDKIGHALLRGRVRRERAQGRRSTFAQANGMKVVEQKIQPTDEDMSGPGRGVQAGRGQGDRGRRRRRRSSPRSPASPRRRASTCRSSATTRRSTRPLLKTPAAEALKANAYVIGLDRAAGRSTSRRSSEVGDDVARRPTRRTREGHPVLRLRAGRRSCTRSSRRPARTGTSRARASSRRRASCRTSTPAGCIAGAARLHQGRRAVGARGVHRAPRRRQRRHQAARRHPRERRRPRASTQGAERR